MGNQSGILPFERRQRATPPVQGMPPKTSDRPSGTAKGLPPFLLILLAWISACLIDVLLNGLHLTAALPAHLRPGGGQLANVLAWLPIGILAGCIPLFQKPCPVYQKWLNQSVLIGCWFLSGFLISPILGLPGEITGFAAGLLLILPFVKVRHAGGFGAAFQKMQEPVHPPIQDESTNRNVAAVTNRKPMVAALIALLFTTAACLAEAVSLWLLARPSASPMGEGLEKLSLTAIHLPGILFLGGSGFLLSFLLSRPNRKSRTAALSLFVLLGIPAVFLVVEALTYGAASARLPLLGGIAENLFIRTGVMPRIISGNLLFVLTFLLGGWSLRGFLPYLAGHRTARMQNSGLHSDNVVPLHRKKA